MSVLRRATDQQQSEWQALPEGLWRFQIAAPPEIKMNENFGKYEARFVLLLTPSEQARLKAEHGDPPEGQSQSWRTNYRPGLSLGWTDKTGMYRSTKLIDFLAACFGHANAKTFRKWIEQGGGPPRPADLDDDKAEIGLIGEWIKWWEGLEVYGTISHRTGKDGTIWSDFAGPMAVGSLPGQRDDEYQAHGRGKLRAMLAEVDDEPERPSPPSQRVPVGAGVRPPAERYTQTGQRVVEDDELPF
jgi:hypothetical protein